MKIYSEDALVHGNYTAEINPYYAFVISDEDAASDNYPSQMNKTPLPIAAPDSDILTHDNYYPVSVVEAELQRVFGAKFKGFFSW